MNRDDIIRMALEAGISNSVAEYYWIELGRMIAAEREAFKAELDKEDPEWLDDEAFHIVLGLQEWLKARSQK